MRPTATPLAILCLATVGLAGEARLFGKPLRGLPATPLAQILDQPEAGKLIRLEGSIEKVCQNKGCWLALKQGSRSVHVTFAGYAFFVPKDCAGKAVVLEGRVLVQEPQAAEVEHLKAEGAGAAAASRVSIEATGVELR